MLEETLTPSKSYIEYKGTSKGHQVQIKYINKKGTFKKRPQCNTCKYLGKVQVGLYYAMGISCDCVEGFWKEPKGNTNRNCAYYQEKVTN